MRSLKAGRKLDARIAKMVMAWEPFTCGYFGTEEETQRMRDLHDWMRRVGLDAVGDYFINEQEEFFVEADEFRPSTDIAAACLVVQKLHPSFWFRAQTGRDMANDPTSFACSVWFGEYAVSDASGWASAASLPLAICRAALNAVGARSVTLPSP